MVRQDQRHLQAGAQHGQDHKAEAFQKVAPKTFGSSNTSSEIACKPETTDHHHNRRGTPDLCQPDDKDNPVAFVGNQVGNGRINQPQTLHEAVEKAILGEDGKPDNADCQIGNAERDGKDVEKEGRAFEPCLRITSAMMIASTNCTGMISTISSSV